MANYYPNPAFVLATLIHNGLATQPTDALPPEWRAAYQAVLACSERTGMYERRPAFRKAIADDPAGLAMEAAVKEAAKDLPLPGQARLFTAWETQYSAPPVSETVVEGVFERSSLNLIVGAPGAKKTWLAIDLAVCVASGQPWLGHSTSLLTEPALRLTSAEQGEGVRVGAPGSKKTWAAIDLAVSVASGQGWLGHKTQQSPVLFIDAEGSVKRMWDRLGATMRGHAVDPRIPLHFVPPAFMNFTRQSDAEYITKVANALDVKLIIIDALVNVMGGTDENNVLSVQPIFDALRGIATNTGAAVVVIHHTNKEGVFRGSSFLSSTVDHMLLVESQPDDPLIRLQTYKARDLAPVLLTARAVFDSAPTDPNLVISSEGALPTDPLRHCEEQPLSRCSGESGRSNLERETFIVEQASRNSSTSGNSKGGLPTFRLALVNSKLQSKLGRTSAAVVDHLAKLKIASPVQLIESVPHLRPSSFRSVIHDLITLGLIFRTDGGGRGSPARYSLTLDGTLFVKGGKINELNPPPPIKTTTSQGKPKSRGAERK